MDKMKSPQTMAEQMKEYGPGARACESSHEESFKCGWQARDQLDETPLKIALEALDYISTESTFSPEYKTPKIQAQEAIAKIKAMQGLK